MNDTLTQGRVYKLWRIKLLDEVLVQVAFYAWCSHKKPRDAGLEERAPWLIEHPSIWGLFLWTDLVILQHRTD